MHKIRDTRTIHDKVTFYAGSEKVTLRVDKDGWQIVSDLNKVREKLSEVTEENMEEREGDCAFSFAQALFGDEQANKLMTLFGNPVSVINVCEQYFSKYLNKKITKAQVRKK